MNWNTIAALLATGVSWATPNACLAWGATGVELLPFVPARRRHQAALRLKRLAIGRRRADRLGARVDCAVGP